MKVIKSIEMASSEDIYEVRFTGEKLTVSPDSDGGGYDVLLDGEEVFWAPSEAEAVETLVKYAVDDHLIISGYGTYSGRKFWQLPDKIQRTIVLMAGYKNE